MTFEIILYTGKKYANGEHPISLKFTNRGDRKIKIAEKGFSVLPDEWSDDSRRPITVKKTDKRYEEFRKIRLKLNDLENRYLTEIGKLEEKGRRMTIDALIDRVENPIEDITVFNYFERVIAQTGGGKYGNSKTFNTCLQRIREFTKGKDIHFHTINLRWLNNFLAFLKEKGSNNTTISIYFRSLRAVINRAIGEEYCDPRDYPFGKKTDVSKFSISQIKTKPNKRSISEKDIQRIKNLDLSNVDAIERIDKFGKKIKPIYAEDMERARMIFLFSYYAAGINFHDICALTWNNIDLDENAIKYNRQKTGKEMITGIHSYNRQILTVQELLTKNDDSDNYVFNILHQHIHNTEAKRYGKIHRDTRAVNEALKEIQNILGIKTKLTTYVARHSVATHLLRGGKSINVVKEELGHSSINTTMSYLAEAKKSEKIDAINSLA